MSTGTTSLAKPSGSQTPPPAPKGGGWRRYGPLALLLIGSALGFWLLRDWLSFDALRDNRESLMQWRDSNYLLAAAVYMLAYVAVVAFSLPGALAMTLTGGFLFGLVAGGAMILFAATIGATAIFLAARAGPGEAMQEKLKGSHGFMARLQAGIAENEVSYLLLMRLVPAVPFFIANLAPAFLGVSLRNYVLTTFFGIMPGTLVYTWVGSGLGEVFDRGESPDLGIFFEPQILGPIVALCLLALLPVLLRALRRRRGRA